MNPKKLDKILNYFREEMTVGNAAVLKVDSVVVLMLKDQLQVMINL